MKTLPIHILAKKIKFWERLESKCNLSNTYDGSANFSDSPKVWQMKLRLWHGILPKNGQCLLGTKKSKIMPNVGFELFLSLPFTFPVLVNENPCQIYTENNQISIFNFFPPKFGALPILQECPCTFRLWLAASGWQLILRQWSKCQLGITYKGQNGQF